MVKKLAKHGNSLALVIDRPVLDLLGIDGDTPLDISTDGTVLIVTPVGDPARAGRVDAIIERINQQYSSTLENLGD
jgi:antitoxin MazE